MNSIMDNIMRSMMDSMMDRLMDSFMDSLMDNIMCNMMDRLMDSLMYNLMDRLEKLKLKLRFRKPRFRKLRKLRLHKLKLRFRMMTTTNSPSPPNQTSYLMPPLTIPIFPPLQMVPPPIPAPPSVPFLDIINPNNRISTPTPLPPKPQDLCSNNTLRSPLPPIQISPTPNLTILIIIIHHPHPLVASPPTLFKPHQLTLNQPQSKRFFCRWPHNQNPNCHEPQRVNSLAGP